jgi:hypothetical protein
VAGAVADTRTEVATEDVPYFRSTKGISYVRGSKASSRIA